MKQPLKQITLQGLYHEAGYIEACITRSKEQGEVDAYFDNTGFLPKNFGENTEGFSQFNYTGRSRADKKLLESMQRRKSLAELTRQSQELSGGYR